VPTQGTIVCYCGSSTTPGSSFTVVVSGSTCTLTFTSDGGGTNDGGGTSDGGANAPFTGAPPQAQTDCMNPQGG